MADIVMADDGIEFDGDSLASGPLGGAETAFVSLANALAAKGHRVRVYNKCNRRIQRNGVEWVPLSSGTPNICDLYIANRSDKLLLLVKNARNAVFWIHNPAGQDAKGKTQIPGRGGPARCFSTIGGSPSVFPVVTWQAVA